MNVNIYQVQYLEYCNCVMLLTRQKYAYMRLDLVCLPPERRIYIVAVASAIRHRNCLSE
jgi:hypothetical protein